MREVGAFEAKNKLSELLDLAEDGEEIVITRHGKQVAKLIPAHQGVDREDARRAAAEIREMRKGVLLGELKIRDLIDEGRK
jgi:prevent-host-death family protein